VRNPYLSRRADLSDIGQFSARLASVHVFPFLHSLSLSLLFFFFFFCDGGGGGGYLFFSRFPISMANRPSPVGTPLICIPGDISTRHNGRRRFGPPRCLSELRNNRLGRLEICKEGARCAMTTVLSATLSGFASVSGVLIGACSAGSPPRNCNLQVGMHEQRLDPGASRTADWFTGRAKTLMCQNVVIYCCTPRLITATPFYPHVCLP
jgi:hypothetical protein